MASGGFDPGGDFRVPQEVELALGQGAETLVNSAERIRSTAESRIAGARQTLDSMANQINERATELREQPSQLADGLLELSGEDFRRGDRSPPPEGGGEDPNIILSCGPDATARIVRCTTEPVPGSIACFVVAELETTTGFGMASMFAEDGEQIGNQILDSKATFHVFRSQPYAMDGADRTIRVDFFCHVPTRAFPEFHSSDTCLAPNCRTSPEPPAPPPEPPSEPPSECPVCEQQVCCCPPPTPPEPPADLRWQVWRRATGNRDCYVISNRQDPEGLDDLLLREFKQQTTAEQYAQENCEQEPPEPPDEPTEPPTGPRFDSLLDGCDLEGLEALLRAAAQKPDVFVQPLRDLEAPLKTILEALEIVGKIPGLNIITSRFVPAVKDVAAAIPIAANLLAQWSASSGCASKPFFEAKGIIMALDTLETWLGFDLNPWGQQVRYIVNAMCPYIQPGAADAIQGWLNGSLTVDRLKSLLAINGICYEDWLPVIEGQRTKLAPGQLVDALYRGYIDEATFQRELRSSGFIEDKDPEVLRQLGKFIAPPTDLIRFMVRDVEDPNIVGPFGLDDDFDAKYQGLSKKFAEQQGVDDETMRRYWRAHWTIPSPTQLYQMFHRLRNDEREEVRTDEDTVRTALQQQDILPFWIPRLLEISFNPLTRVDTRRAFDLGDIDESGVKKSYAAQGYNDENIETLTKFSRTLKYEGVDGQRPVALYKQSLGSEEEARRKLTERGFPEEVINDALIRVQAHHERTAHSLRPYKQYVDGLLSEDEFRRELRDRYFVPVVIDRVVNLANREIERESRKRCAEAVKTRYFWGELTEGEVREELNALGYPPLMSQARAEQYTCELVKAEKQGTLREFRRWLEFGTATPAEIEERLRRLKYSEDSARRIVAAMVERLRQQELDEIARERRRIERDLKREQKERVRNEKQQKALIERARKAALKAKDAREKRALQIEKAAVKYSDKFGDGLAETQDRLQALRLFVRNSTSLNRDRETEAIVRAVDAAVKLENQDLEGLVTSIADSVESWLDDQA